PFTVAAPNVVEDGEEAGSLASVRVDDGSGCPRYVARIFTGIAIGSSPWWMRRRLLACGMRPISNVVDVTNYVLLERGQPLHAFDLDRLDGSAIVVRKPKKGEQITTLDGQQRALDRNDVVICDASKPVAVAGVMGGAESEVSGSTTRILLESATFDPIRVRTTAARLGLRTEASARFEKGSDPELPPAAAGRAAELFAQLAGARVARGAIDVYKKGARIKPITLRVARASTIIGEPQDASKAAAGLRSLGFDVEEKKSALRVVRPSWRPDVTEEVDVIEEVARAFGYENVAARLPVGARRGALTVGQAARRLARVLLLGAGVHEAQTLSLLPPGLPDRLDLPADHQLRRARRVMNPLSEEESVLRASLVPGLLLAARRNVARRVLPVKLFEIGVVFEPRVDGHERWDVAFVLCGPSEPSWFAPQRELDFFDAKGILEGLIDGLGVGAHVEPLQQADAFYNPGRAGEIVAGSERLGMIAELHPRAAEALELPPRVAVGTLDLDRVIALMSPSSAAAPARFPAVGRDLALVVPEAAHAADVEAVIRDAGGAAVESIRLFDRYRGDQVEGGHVSLAFTLSLRAAERTMTDDEADAVIEAIVGAVAARGWSVRS
ncbi:MAG: phenylalanine--tRNA ligase subunit beta, partial [Actinomycetota bacterium]